uniref:Uncharacterized protein n=1 Tax=Schizaphis graminum TaxID=13262 RepID=A0A2S2NN26_SCHGA
MLLNMCNSLQIVSVHSSEAADSSQNEIVAIAVRIDDQMDRVQPRPSRLPRLTPPPPPPLMSQFRSRTYSVSIFLSKPLNSGNFRSLKYIDRYSEVLVVQS